MYKELVTLLRKKYDKAPLVMAAADVIEELAALDFIPCWVSVSDRLPEDGKMYCAGFSTIIAKSVQLSVVTARLSSCGI